MAEIEAILSIFADNKTGGAFSDIEKTGNTVSNNLKQAFSSININNLKSQLEELLNETFTVNVNFNGANPNQNNNSNEGNSNEGRTANNAENNANNSNSERLNNVLNTVISVFIELSDVVSSLTIDFDEFQSNVESITLVSQDLQTTFQALIEYIRTVLNGNQNNNNRNRNNSNRDNGRNDENVRTENTSSTGSEQSNPSAEQFNQTAEAINDATDNANEYLKILNRIGTDGVKSISSLGESFRGIGQSLQGVSSLIGKLVSIIGSSSLLQNFVDQASERQTNKMMLEAKSREPGSTIDADEYYTAINQKVIELPGNDQFLNQILTQIAVMEDYSTTEIEGMADIITNYYMLARAKGQTNFETEKEIRNYILTGNTKGLENSVLATEIKLLKEGNNVKERTILIEKAMQNIHMDGMAHYESYMNSMETFVGHFQKASADIGEKILAVLTPVIRLYNAIDDLTFEGLSASILIVLTAVVGIIGGLTIFGSIMIQTANVVNNVGEAYKTLSALMMLTNDMSIIQAVYLSFLGTAYGKANAQIALNTAIEEGSISAKIMDKAVTLLLGEAVMYEAGTVMHGSVVLEQDVLIRERGIITRISETFHRFWNSVAVYEETISIGINTEATANEVVAKNLDIGATLRSAIAHIKDAISRRLSSNATLRQIVTKLRKIAIQVWEFAQTVALAIAEQILVAVKGEEAVANTVLAGSTLTLKASIDALKVSLGPIGVIFDAIGLSMYAIIAIIGAIVGGFLLLTNTGGSLDFLKGIFDDIWGGLNRIWEAFMNSEPVQEAITTFQNFAYAVEGLFNWLGSIGGFLWELIFGVSDDATSEGFDILGLLLEIGGAIGNFLYWLSPLEEIFAVFNAIGSAIDWFLVTWNKFMHSAEMDALVTAFQELRKAFGEVFRELSEAFGELWSAFSEVGEAFGSIFEDDSQTQEVADDTNVLLDVLKSTATFIKDYVVPVIHLLVIPFKVLAEVIRTIAEVIKSVVGFISDPLGSIKGLGNAIVNEFTSIPGRIIGSILGIPNQIFGGLVDGVLNILGIHSPGFIQEAVVNEFLNIPRRILDGVSIVTTAVGNFASAIWGGFDSIFGTHMQDTVDKFFDGLDKGFNKLKEGDIIGAVKEFGDNFLNTLDNIFGTDISGMVGGFFDQISSNLNKIMSGDILGVVEDTGNWFNDSIKRFTGVDIGSIINGSSFGFDEKASAQQLKRGVDMWNNPSQWNTLANEGLMQNPQNLVTGQTLTQNYNNATNHSPTIVNNNFGEGSVQADARNMSAKDVQTLFTGAFGYNKARGTQGILG